MATYRYPQNDFDRPDVLLDLLGSFWSSTYGDAEFVRDYAAATGYDAQQTYLQLLDLVNSVSRFSIPLYKSEAWFALTLRESQLRRNLRPRVYGAGTYSDSGPAYGSTQTTVYFHVDKPAELSHAPYVFDRLIEPAVAWARGFDFDLDDTEIFFLRNPFEQPSIPLRDVLDAEGQIVDRELTLWLYRGEWDWDTVYEQFGYVLELSMRTSEGYKSFLNSIFDGLILGTSRRLQCWALAAIFGVPATREPVETVEEIRTDLTEVAIVTDKHAYVFPSAAVATVAVGDVLQAGTFLTDTLQLFEFTRGQVPTTEELAALTLENGMLAHGYWHGLTFANTLVPTTVETRDDGYTRISWPLGGFSLDVEKFWDDVHAAGVAKGQTLAMLLDTRESPVDQPFAACLPAYVNPLQFLTENFLRANAYVVKLKANVPRSKALAFIPHDCLAKIQPPHTVMLFVLELVKQDAPIIMESAGTEQAPGYTETLAGFPCSVQTETIDPTVVIQEKLSVGLVGGHCV
jgi:hypothetical protein